MPQAANHWRIAKSPDGQNVFSSWLDTSVVAVPADDQGLMPLPPPATPNWVEMLRHKERFKSLPHPPAAQPWKALTPVHPTPALEASPPADAPARAPALSTDTTTTPVTTPSPAAANPPARQQIYAELIRRTHDGQTPGFPAPRADNPPTSGIAAIGYTPPGRADPKLVQALLPGVLQALAEALRQQADQLTMDLSTSASASINNAEIMPINSEPAARVLLEQTRTLIANALTLAHNLAATTSR